MVKKKKIIVSLSDEHVAMLEWVSCSSGVSFDDALLALLYFCLDKNVKDFEIAKEKGLVISNDGGI